MITDVILSQNAYTELIKLPKHDQQKIKKKLAVLLNEPALGKKLSGEFSGIRSLRAWPYRILYEIQDDKERIEVVKIAHRQGVYR